MKHIDHSKNQVDLYSLGIILYQLVFGKLPFQSQDFIIFIEGSQKQPLKLQGNSEYNQYIEKMICITLIKE
ncbi:unnamed protein product [Paramecium sonneborni]|uniref:Protein kinase domain-containing protein n=1 Tax=Paramecium sonneborni TaxID=65129 RepID=A0A8S1LPC4_9CILI|nr:unnamed protein product [Paramecium sonneborni]CAD8069611.1 unnamed protein product [Paramecium sonneborni]